MISRESSKLTASACCSAAGRSCSRGLVLSIFAMAIILIPTGCTLWNKPAPQSISVASTSAGGTLGPSAPANYPAVGPKAAPDELPAKQTARLCAATAEDMQKKGFTEQAIFLYEKARENDPKLPNVAHHLALLYDQQGDAARSLNEFKQAIETTPKDPDLMNDFGYYHYHHGNMADAENWYRKALGISPNHAQALTNLAIVLGHQRRYQESIEKFTRVVGPAAAYSNVGVLMMEQGDRGQAHDAFTQAQRLDPTLKQPQAFLAYLDRDGAIKIAAAKMDHALPTSLVDPRLASYGVDSAVSAQH
jgi:Tfp pilus assembly protein PilF